MTIRHLIEKCKSDDVLIVAVIVLVGLGSFGLGRLSKIEEGKAPVVIEGREAVALVGEARSVPSAPAVSKKNFDSFASSTPASGSVVGSKSGRTYHYPWCSGASRISEKNKVWFESSEAARRAGYRPAGNCKGLR